LGRTIRRQPVTNNIPTAPKKYYFNITAFKGISRTDNPFNEDTSTCSDALNVYVDEDNALATRPRTEVKYNLTNITNFKKAISLTFIDEKYLLQYYTTDDKAHICWVSTDGTVTPITGEVGTSKIEIRKGKGYYVFVDGVSYKYIDATTNAISLASEHAYTPTTKVGVSLFALDGGNDFESANILTKNYYKTYGTPNTQTQEDILNIDYSILSTIRETPREYALVSATGKTFTTNNKADLDTFLDAATWTASSFAMSPDGKHILVVDTNDSNIYAIIDKVSISHDYGKTFKYLDISTETDTGHIMIGYSPSGNFCYAATEKFIWLSTDNFETYNKINITADASYTILNQWGFPSNSKCTNKYIVLNTFIHTPDMQEGTARSGLCILDTTSENPAPVWRLPSNINISSWDIAENPQTGVLELLYTTSGEDNYFCANAVTSIDGTILQPTGLPVNFFSSFFGVNNTINIVTTEEYNLSQQQYKHCIYVFNPATNQVTKVAELQDTSTKKYAFYNWVKNKNKICFTNNYSNRDDTVIYDYFEQTFTILPIKTERWSLHFSFWVVYNTIFIKPQINGYTGQKSPVYTNRPFALNTDFLKILYQSEEHAEKTYVNSAIHLIDFNNTLFIGGNSNLICHTDVDANTFENNYLYLPMKNRAYVGTNDDKITSFNMLSDTGMLAYTKDNVYIIYYDATNNVYTYNKTKTPYGHISNRNATTTPISDTPIIINNNGIFAFQAVANYQTTDKSSVLISEAINPILFKETQLDKTFMCNHKYWTLLFVPKGNITKVYLLDDRTQQFFYWELYCKVIDAIELDGDVNLLTENGYVLTFTTEDIYKQYGALEKTVYYDVYNTESVRIPWEWKSQILPLNTINYLKTLVNTSFMVSDSDESDNYGFSFVLTSFKRRANYNTSEKTLKENLQGIKSRTIRTPITRFNFLRLNLSNMEDDSQHDYTKLRLVGIALKYRLLEMNQ